MFRLFKKNKSAVTLIELSLYIGLSTIIILGSSLLLKTVMDSRSKDTTISEVEQQGNLALQTITRSIRNATLVNSPAIGATSSSLSLNTTVSGNNPTVFSLASGVISMKEGSATAIPLTGSRVTISNLLFQNLAQTGTKDNLRVSFTVTYRATSTQQQYQYSRDFLDSAARR